MTRNAFDVVCGLFGEVVTVTSGGSSVSVTGVFEPAKPQDEVHMQAYEAVFWVPADAVSLEYGAHIERQDGEVWRVVQVVKVGDLLKAYVKSHVRPTP